MTVSNEDSILYQPQFPNSKGGRPISFLRIVKDGEDCLVAKVISHIHRRAEVIATCRIEEGFRCISFKTTTADYGHQELCELLELKGVGGKYREWLLAKKNGYKALEEENRGLSTIRFECDPVDGDEAKDWLRKLEFTSKKNNEESR